MVDMVDPKTVVTVAFERSTCGRPEIAQTKRSVNRLGNVRAFCIRGRVDSLRAIFDLDEAKKQVRGCAMAKQ